MRHVRRRRRGLWLGALALIAATGCSGLDGAATGTTSGAASAAPEDDTPPGNPTRGPDPVAGAPTPALIERAGAPAERVGAPQADLVDPVAKFADGLQVSITKTTHGTIDAQGPGEINGEPYTLFDVEVTNGSAEPIDTSRVVAALTYGDPPLTARNVYADEVRDLSGVVAPGKTATASYAFSVPPQQLTDVTLSLDIDGRHGLAVFSGEVAK